MVKLRKDMVQCKSCRRMLYRDQFTISRGVTVTSRCLTCIGLYRRCILRADMNLYRRMLQELRHDEQEQGVESSITYIIDVSADRKSNCRILVLGWNPFYFTGFWHPISHWGHMARPVRLEWHQWPILVAHLSLAKESTLDTLELCLADWGRIRRSFAHRRYAISKYLCRLTGSRWNLTRWLNDLFGDRHINHHFLRKCDFAITLPVGTSKGRLK